jgi:hypothetical protein
MERTNQTQTNQNVIEAPYRSTGMGGVTRPIALKLEGGRLRLVNPVRVVLSRSGRHGVWLYRRGDLDVLLYLEMSNSGKPSVFIEICDLPQDVCQRIYDVAYNAWVVDDLEAREVEHVLELVEV